jgi:DtxR family Mn-dependent transcriptional regulator
MASASSPELSASLEDYLQAIFWIVKEKQAARAKDISDRLKVARSSVTGALRALAERKLINYAPYDVITLTGEGHVVAEEVVRRHEVLRDFFVEVLAVEEQEADDAACRMEHAVTPEIVERLVAFAEFFERCPRAGAEWASSRGYRCKDYVEGEGCETCLERTLQQVRKKNMEKRAGTDAATTLAAMTRGEKASIVKISGSGGIRRRLLDMGATTGTIVEVERVAPLGDPIEVKIKGYHLTLRKEEANRIIVQPV